MKDVIKVRFVKDCEAVGREYTYYTPEPVKVGDLVDVETNHGVTQAVVSKINVPLEEITRFGNKAKAIIGRTVCRCEDCLHCIPVGEGDHLCDADPMRMPLQGYAPTADYRWCLGCFYCKRADKPAEQMNLFPTAKPGTPWDCL